LDGFDSSEGVIVGSGPLFRVPPTPKVLSQIRGSPGHVITMDTKSNSYKGTAGLHKRKAEGEMGSDKEKSRKVGVVPIKPGINKSAILTNIAATTKNGSTITSTPKSESANSSTSTTSVPKPGSYKALLAKAAATHQAQKAKVGTGGVRHINHREQQKKREEEARLIAKAKGKLPVKIPAKSTEKPSSNIAKPGPATKPKPPSPPKSTYKGTAGLGRPGQARDILRKRSSLGGPPPRRREYYSDDEEEEEEEDYDSGSDMEADMGDIDEEEEAALLAAQLEDKREQELERKLKAEKEARRKRL
jgi:protein SPT2